MSQFKQLMLLYWASLILVSLSMLFILNSPGYAYPILALGLLSQLIFIVKSVKEVRSLNIDKLSRNFWTIALIISSNLAGIFYLFLFRRRYFQN